MNYSETDTPLLRERYDIVILLIIIAVGGILRFYGFSNIPLTHDELSAVLRLQYDTIKELIEYGVKEDGHPAGVQLFLYFWTRAFGSTPEAVKIPFMLMGLGSIPLAYSVSKMWFNRTGALLVSAYMATLQFPVMYSQIARPYISGLFFCLFMVWCWTRLLYGYNRNRIIHSAGYILSATICCYNHHFSLLFAIIVGVTGLFLIEKRNAWLYLASLAVISLLYIPHLPLFFYQLNKGGLNWLGEPRISFLTDYIQYIFHFSPAVYVTTILLFLIGIFRNRLVLPAASRRKLQPDEVNRSKGEFDEVNRSKGEPDEVNTPAEFKIWPHKKFQVISLIWFLLPVIVGFAYSRLVSPVIQYSVLIFSFPFLLFFLFSFYKPTSSGFKMILVIVVMAINISTLIWTRKHYEVFYKQPIREFAYLTADFLATHDPSQVCILFNENPEYIDYYFSELNPGITYHSVFGEEMRPEDFRKWAGSKDARYMILGSIQRDWISIIREFYPHMVFKDFGFTYEYFIFSKDKQSQSPLPREGILFMDSLNYRNRNDNWHHTDHLDIRETDGYSFCVLDSIREWGPRFETRLSDIAKTRYDFIDIGLEVKSVKQDPGLIVCEIIKEGENVTWRAAAIGEFWDPDKRSSWQWAYLCLRLSGIFRKSVAMEDCMIRVYYWNKGKEEIELRGFKIRVTEGNQRIYSLIEPLK